MLNKVRRKCEECGKVFYVFPCRIRKKRGRFCSHKCKYLYFKGEKNPIWGDKNPNWGGGKPTRICKRCGKVFQRTDDSRRGKGKYCSTKCYWESLTFGVSRFCKICGKKIWVRPSRPNHQYCSQWCAGRDKIGEKSPLWNGMTPIVTSIRKLFEYRQWRSDILQRDNYICQECGIRGGNLEAHHIKPFWKIIKENNIKTKEEAMVCDELWNLNNGITLCVKCHKRSGRPALGHRLMCEGRTQ
jgi:hypothetical protein